MRSRPFVKQTDCETSNLNKITRICFYCVTKVKRCQKDKRHFECDYQ